ncbi:hypothetical protein QZM46_07970 [Burkholderia vietnamiensis]|uniref:Uncharacterized protein n=2 Tax=Burkholderia vietnamiensis TaxID=60552 RepID=A0AAW7T0N9_BURVI|nr:hypothetical protein [Burkholderia vietnamiensis]MDN7551276.1 hypothetical protein [Burkholderia vietnamiensis]MDN7795090.1 hypothetical protein [Burkholderia vietnamiensis]MDN8043602.1 hypothetical protein [Burkholderia vietnamiensis]MDN8073773.1 hypothetical protein [Burkholderia vietnamiensis]
MAAVYAPGTVRARRWHGDGEVRGYRPPSGWTARADLADIHPITGRVLARPQLRRCHRQPRSSASLPARR